MNDSFASLVNNNDWVEIKWVDAVMGTDGETVNIPQTDGASCGNEDEPQSRTEFFSLIHEICPF